MTTEEFAEGFHHGVFYERCRIMENLRLAMPKVDGELQEMVNRGAVPMVPLEEILDWSLSVLQQPIHEWAEAQHVLNSSVEIVMRDFNNTLEEMEQRDPEAAKALRQLMDTIGEEER